MVIAPKKSSLSVDVNLPRCAAARRFPVRIAIAHPNVLLAELLELCCRAQWRCEVLARITDPADCIVRVQTDQPDIVILGTDSASFNPLTLVPALTRVRHAMKVIVSTRTLNEYVVYKLSQLEVHGVVEETSAALGSFGNAIAAVRAGLRHRCDNFLRLTHARTHNPASFDKQLTKRQEEVLRCIAFSMTDTEVAHQLGLTRITAKKHRADILQKLGIRGSTQLVRRAQELGFGSFGFSPKLGQ